MAAKKRSNLEKVIFAYVTTKDKKQAEVIGRSLIEKKLAACVNIIPSMYSSYRWQGKIEKSSESVLIVKSLQSKKNAIQSEVKRLHSYDVPCILFFKAEGGNPDYLHWIYQECL